MYLFFPIFVNLGVLLIIFARTAEITGFDALIWLVGLYIYIYIYVCVYVYAYVYMCIYIDIDIQNQQDLWKCVTHM